MFRSIYPDIPFHHTTHPLTPYTNTILLLFSGGGFSNIYELPHWQKATVKAYLASITDNPPYTSISGINALSVGGCSQGGCSKGGNSVASPFTYTSSPSPGGMGGAGNDTDYYQYPFPSYNIKVTTMTTKTYFKLSIYILPLPNLPLSTLILA